MEPTTVVFDVGGTEYKVSKSLLLQYPDTMLARMTSDEWQEGNVEGGSPIFIERNGERFQFVLDYMRDQEVSIPSTSTTTQKSFLKELEYFGFDKVEDPSSCITIGFSTTGAIKELCRLRDSPRSSARKLRRAADCKIIADHIYSKYLGRGLQAEFVVETDIDIHGVVKDAFVNVLSKTNYKYSHTNTMLTTINNRMQTFYGIQIKEIEPMRSSWFVTMLV